MTMVDVSRDASGTLPRGWTCATIGDLTQLVTSGSRGWAAYYSADGSLFLRVGNLDHGSIALDLSDVVHVRPPAGAEGVRTRVEPGDILLSITADVGMIAIVPDGLGDAYINQHVALIRLRPSVLPRAIAYSLLDPNGFQRLVREAQYGATKAGLNLNQVRRFEIPVPPIEEQARIVEAIETHLTRLDAAVVALERVQANLKRYRASVLKAAVEGRLVPTEAELARREGRDYEPASVLLQRILAERRRRWEEAELAAMKAKGKVPKDDKWTQKYKVPVQPDTEGMPELPEGWCWSSLEALTSAVRVICYGILMPKEHVAAGVPYVKVRDMRSERLEIDKLERTAPEIAAKYARASLRGGDLLLAIRGTYGRVVEVPPELEGGNITQDTARVVLHPVLNSAYVATFLRSPDAQKYFKRVARGVAVKGVNIADVRATPIPLPPVGEQQRICDEVARLVSVGTALDAGLASEQARTNRLRQSILKWAFEGKLVDQDPNDEPASVLLDRLHAERRESRPPDGGTRRAARPSRRRAT